MQSFKRALWALTAVGTLAMALLAVPTEAGAEVQTPAAKKYTPATVCTPHKNAAAGYYEESYVCVRKDEHNTIWPVVTYLNGNDVQYGTEHYFEAVVYLQRCQVDGSNCTTLAANSDARYTEGGWMSLETSRRQGSYGWVYRGCASLEVTPAPPLMTYVNSCSPWVTGNPSADVQYLLPSVVG